MDFIYSNDAVKKNIIHTYTKTIIGIFFVIIVILILYLMLLLNYENLNSYYILSLVFILSLTFLSIIGLYIFIHDAKTFYINHKLSYENKTISYKYFDKKVDDNESAHYEYQIHSVTSYKEKQNRFVIYGDIDRKLCYLNNTKKETKTKKVIIKKYFENTEEFRKILEEMR